jgi:hypothetical protein
MAADTAVLRGSIRYTFSPFATNTSGERIRINNSDGNEIRILRKSAESGFFDFKIRDLVLLLRISIF